MPLRYLCSFLLTGALPVLLFSQNIKQTLDSVVATQPSGFYQRKAHTYNPQGQRTHLTTYFAFQAGDPLKADDSTFYEYDSQDRIRQTTATRFDGNGVPTPTVRVQTYYDTAGVDRMTITQDWNGNNQSWINRTQAAEQLNSHGLPLSRQAFWWAAGSQQWQAQPSNTTLSYLPSGKQKSVGISNGFLFRTVEHRYDTQNILQQTLQYDTVLQGVPDSNVRFRFNYDNRQRLSQYEIDGKGPNNTWQAQRRYSVSHDTLAGNLLSITADEYRWVGGQWLFHAKRQWEHDYTVPYSDLVTLDFSTDSLAQQRLGGIGAPPQTFGSAYRLVRFREFVDPLGDTLFWQQTYHYSFRLIGEEEETLPTLKLYPNPSTGMVHLELPKEEQEVEVRIVTIDGRAVNTRAFRDQKQIQMQLPEVKGVYIIEVQTPRDLLGRSKVLRQ